MKKIISRKKYVRCLNNGQITHHHNYLLLNDATRDYLVNHFTFGLVVSAKEVNVRLYLFV